MKMGKIKIALALIALTSLSFVNKDTLYFKHNFFYKSKIESSFNVELPEDSICQKIKRKLDKYDDKITFISPTEDGISFTKIIRKNNATIYLSVTTTSWNLALNKNGLTILFEDGTKFSKPSAVIESDLIRLGVYQYSAFVQLNSADISKLKEKFITDIKLYTFEGYVDYYSAKKIREYLECMTL